MNKTREFLKKYERFLITSHKNPDGDAIGSQIGLALALQKMGKDVIVVDTDPVPKRFRYFERIDLVQNEIEDFDYQAVIVLDSSGPERLGSISEKIDFTKPVANIDHHISNKYFGTVNLVQPERSSTCEIVYLLLKDFVELDKEIATYLYLGLLTDTGSFRYANTQAESLRHASELLSYGVDASSVAERIWFRDTPGRLKLLGSVLETIEIFDGFSMMYVTREMMERYNTTEEDTEEFASYGLTIDGVRATAFVKERDGEIKVSLRSKKGTDVDRIAAIYGGGGHKSAAGFTVKGKNFFSFIEELKRVMEENI